MSFRPAKDNTVRPWFNNDKKIHSRVWWHTPGPKADISGLEASLGYTASSRHQVG